MPMKLVFVLCLVVTIAIFIAICMAVDELEAKKLFKDLKQRNEEYRRARKETVRPLRMCSTVSRWFVFTRWWKGARTVKRRPFTTTRMRATGPLQGGTETLPV